ncbi:hypothetical protein AAZV13_18G082050 [Glycine max]
MSNFITIRALFLYDFPEKQIAPLGCCRWPSSTIRVMVVGMKSTCFGGFYLGHQLSLVLVLMELVLQVILSKNMAALILIRVHGMRNNTLIRRSRILLIQKKLGL